MADDGTFGREEVARRLLAALVEAGSLRKLAARWGCAPSYLSAVCNGRIPAGPKLLRPMGLAAIKRPAPVWDRRGYHRDYPTTCMYRELNEHEKQDE